MWEGGARVPCVMRWPKEIRDKWQSPILPLQLIFYLPLQTL